VTTQLDPALILFLERLVRFAESAECGGYDTCVDGDELEALADVAREALEAGALPLPPPRARDLYHSPPKPRRKRKYRSTEQGRALVRRAISNVRTSRQGLSTHEAVWANLRYLLALEVWE
jgi:hypothetical protein